MNNIPPEIISITHSGKGPWLLNKVKLKNSDGKTTITYWNRSTLKLELFRRKLPEELLSEFEDVVLDQRIEAMTEAQQD